MIGRMPFKLPLILYIVPAIFRDRVDLVAENLALRHRHLAQYAQLPIADRDGWQPGNERATG